MTQIRMISTDLFILIGSRIKFALELDDGLAVILLGKNQ